MEKKEAKELIEKYHRSSIKPELAKELAEAFGIEFDEDLIYTKLRPREIAKEVPRVSVEELAQDIVEKLGLTPDEALMATANRMHGIGSFCELSVKACLMVM